MSLSLREYLDLDAGLRRQEAADRAAGLDDSPAQDAIRDRMDGPWYRMTAAEHRAARVIVAYRTAKGSA